MNFKGILLDIDNTLYDYQSAHESGLNKTIGFASSKTGISMKKLYLFYAKARQKTHENLKGTAASHDRLIYFQCMLEDLGLSPFLAPELNRVYWNEFLRNIKPGKGVVEFLELNKEIKICIVSDFNAAIQYEKIKILGIEKYISSVVTSEEVGKDKPNEEIFKKAISKLGIRKADICMIGDDYDKDILGAVKSGVTSFWLTAEGKLDPKLEKKVTIIRDFDELISLWNGGELKELIKLSKYYGSQTDMVQAGGGNISVKTADFSIMFIKASGFSLSEVSETNGYSVIRNSVLALALNYKKLYKLGLNKRCLYGEKIMKTALENGPRPSMEMFMHAILKRYVIHTHPEVVNVMSSSSGWKKLKQIIPEAVYIDYEIPGIDLALKIEEKFDKKNQSIIFLKNHGLVVTSDSYKEVMELHERVICLIKDTLGYKQSVSNINWISETIRNLCGSRWIVYQSDDFTIKRLSCYIDMAKSEPFTPDMAVYCGHQIIRLRNAVDVQTIKSYFVKYCEPPKVLIYKMNVFFVADTVNKAREIEMVYKSHLNIVFLAKKKKYRIDRLTSGEVDILLNLKAEKYRQDRTKN